MDAHHHRPHGTHRETRTLSGLPLGAAVAVVACLLAAAWEEPLPRLGWAAAFLLLAVERDVRLRRIPNWLTFSGVILALALCGWQGGADALLPALAGAGAGFALLIVPFAAGALGAGDVKAAMVLGALWGAGALFEVLAWSVLAGGGLALGLLIARGGGTDLVRRWLDTLQLTLRSGRLRYVKPAPGSVAASGLPFAVALGLGAAAAHAWRLPWTP